MARKDKKQIIINCEELETRCAMLKNARLEEYEIERPSDDILAGSIYLGKIVRLEPSLEAAFVDIGAEKNAFLHYRDMLPATHDIVDNIKRINESAPAPEQPGRKKRFLSGVSQKLRNFFFDVTKEVRIIILQWLNLTHPITDFLGINDDRKGLIV